MIYKPYGMLSQFTPEEGNPSLADLNFKFPRDVYPVGRLDKNSEGLLILTNDNVLKHKLLNPENKHSRIYYAQVEGIITNEAISTLANRMIISVRGKSYTCLPAIVEKIEEPLLPPRIPPVRFRKNIPTSWISIHLNEGKNHQVRHMCAKTGFPVLRLVRVCFAGITLKGLQPGEIAEIKRADIKWQV